MFLSESWCLHPDVCKFTSEVFYDGRLVSRPENDKQRLNDRGPLDGTGLRFAPVQHSGNQSVILPKEILERLRVGKGDSLYVVETKNGIQLTAPNKWRLPSV
ncbi:hypothetical protein BH18ACI4_BH18ACI4_08630 [soil metagenome]